MLRSLAEESAERIVALEAAVDPELLAGGEGDPLDEGLREQIEDVVGEPLEDEDYTGAVDAAILWWRDGDGDLSGYRAEGEPPFIALMSSVYTRTNGTWRLALYQQTPVPAQA